MMGELKRVKESTNRAREWRTSYKQYSPSKLAMEFLNPNLIDKRLRVMQT
jgi:hypothetical protein